jgi:hypothetical protein
LEATTERAALMATDLFEKFWNIYPRRIAKGAALKAFTKLDPSEELVDEMIRAIGAQARYRREMDSANQFVAPWKHPATWLNGQCWEDELGSVSALREKAIPGICECGQIEFMKSQHSPNGKAICQACYANLTIGKPKALNDEQKRELWEKIKHSHLPLAAVVRQLRESFNQSRNMELDKTKRYNPGEDVS